MERIVYNKTLDVHKSGVQFTLQGFETADRMSRRVVISLMENGDTFDLPLEQLEAVMYVTTPGIAETSINACTIKDNTVIYDALPITEEGITIMQLKLIETRPDGVASVLTAPRFAVEVVKSDVEDESIKGTASYTAVEEALSRANSVYDSRLLRIALDSECVFSAYYADGTVYQSDVLKEIVWRGDAVVAKSYAVGGTGIRDGEETDNSMYYSDIASSMATETKEAGKNALAILDEVKKHGVYTVFDANFETGELVYESPKYDFEVDKETGELKTVGKTYTIEENMVYVIEEWLRGFGVTFPEFKASVDKNTEDIEGLTKTVEEHSSFLATIYEKVLWTNPAATEKFLAQTISLDLSEYKRFRVVWKEYRISENKYHESEYTVKDKHLVFEIYDPSVHYERIVTITDTGISFDDADSGGGSYIIPVKIIGYKY